MERRKLVNQSAVGLLRERRCQVVRAQPGLQVHYRYPAPERRECGGQCGARIALHYHRVGPVLAYVGVEPCDELAHQLGLAAEHPRNGNRCVGPQTERRKSLLEHHWMLTARDEQRLHASHLPQSISQRRELDRLRPGATDEVDNRRSPGMMMRSHTDPRKTRYAPTGDISFSMLKHNSPNF